MFIEIILETQAAVKKEPCHCGDYGALRKNYRELQEENSRLSQILKLREQELAILTEKDVVKIE